MSKYIITILVLVAALAGWWWFFPSTVAPELQMQATNTTPQDTQAPAQEASVYTMAEVQAHGSASSCWSVVDGNVYDLTAWIGRHPGGVEAIESMCGKDGSAGFHGQHGTDRKETNILESMRIGALAH